MSLKLKVCKSCKLEKPLDDFYRETKASDGRKASCKLCMNEKKKLAKKEKLEFNKPSKVNGKFIYSKSLKYKTLSGKRVLNLVKFNVKKYDLVGVIEGDDEVTTWQSSTGKFNINRDTTPFDLVAIEM